MKKVLSPILFFLIGTLGFANGSKDSKEHYRKAFNELSAMMNDEALLSFKKAVFLTENAYLDNTLRYETYTEEINFLVTLARSVISSDILEYDYADRSTIEKAAAIYKVLKDETEFTIPNDTAQLRLNWKPYTYDMEDFWGEKDWSKMFVSKLLITQKGNCHSLPLLYKILAEELEVPAYLSIAPNHTYIKQWSDAKGWYNTELTTGYFPYDKDIKWNSYIKTEAVANGVYMDTVSNKQSIAYLITDLAQGYVKKFGYSDLTTPINWLESALTHYPNYVNALILRAELKKKRMEQLMRISGSEFEDVRKDADMRQMLDELEREYMAIHQLGYRRMPKEMYLNWLFRVNKDTTRKPHKFKTPQPFKDYGYDVFVATAGDGQNYEFYDQDTLARIGTVELNRLTGKIVRFIKYDYSKEMPDEVISRMYDPALGRFWQIDPLSEDFFNWSPYTFAFNNPIRYTDPDGMAPWDVIIKGEKSKEVFNQLNASTSLRLKIDDNGKVTAKGKARTGADKTLLEAINSEAVEVNINATDGNFTDGGKWFVGGAFGGSDVKDGKTITSQTVNPEQTEKIDNFYGAEKGVSVLHEVLESYVGGKNSPGIGAPTFDDVQNKTVTGVGYEKAHNRVKALDPRHVSPNIVVDPKGIYITKFPYSPSIPKALNPELLINNLKK